MTFQGEHSDEYLLREGKSGRCSLFCKGVLKLSWKEVNGVKVGGFTLYEKGKAMIRENWTSLWNEREHRYIENCKSGLELVIENNQVVYRGGFDAVESMKREGKGTEFDAKSGRVLRCGVWKNDELFQITHEFESDEVMIEYETEEGISNLNVLNRHPVYEGGYMFDEAIWRHGEGCEIDINTGIAVREGVWEKGELKESTELFDGWYVKMEEKELKVEITHLNDWLNLEGNLTILTIPSNSCNERELNVFDVSKLNHLKRIEIGDDCFENVSEVRLIGLKQIKSIVIGRNSFTRYKNEEGKDPSRHFYLKQCPLIKSLKIGRGSFSDYSVCEIENLPSLEGIEMGDVHGDNDDEFSYNFFYANLELRGDYSK